MEIESQIPQEEESLCNHTPFKFSIQGHNFYMDPLCLTDYIKVDRSIHQSIQKLLYASFLDAEIEWEKQLDELTDVQKQGMKALEHHKNLSEILYDLAYLENNDPKLVKSLINDYNKKNWLKPSRKIKKINDSEEDLSRQFKEWFQMSIELDDLIKGAGYFLRFCSEFKKKMSLILQKGITNFTKSQEKAMNQNLQESLEEEWTPGFQEIGQEMMAMVTPIA